MKRISLACSMLTCLFALPRGASAQSITNGDFSGGLTGWNATQLGGGPAPGGVSAVDGQALLVEGDSAFVSLSQPFTVPAGAQTLSFSFLTLPGFDQTDAFFPDAFESSLLRPDKTSAVPTWKPEATSFFNSQQNGVVHLGQGVSFSGNVVTLNVSGIPSGTQVTLYFDLLGADHDAGSGVRVDGVAVTGGPTCSPPDCNDNNACTTDTCDAGMCQHAPIQCPTGQQCVAGACVPVADPCADLDGDGKIQICHIPPGKPGNAHTITININALSAHLGHGDYCGPCQ